MISGVTATKITIIFLAVVLIALPLATVVFSAYTGHRPLFFLSATGQHAKQNAFAVTVDGFRGTSCSVTFQSAQETHTEVFNPCKFTYNPAATKTALNINSVSLGRLENELDYEIKWAHGRSGHSNYYNYRSEGMAFKDNQGDALKWALKGDKAGEKQVQTLSERGRTCLSANQQCYVSVSNPRKGCSVVGGSYCDSCTCYTQITQGTRIEDTSGTFRLTASTGTTEKSCFGGCSDLPTYQRYTLEFEIINDNFYASEELARDTIISEPHYRDIDCPIKTGYMLATQDFATGTTLNLDSFAYPVNYFCKSVPAVILDAEGNQITTSTDIYQQLLSGDSVRVPNDQVWELFYVMRVTDDVPIICTPEIVDPLPDGKCPEWTEESADGTCYAQSMYDPSEGCVIKPGIVHFCREGIWDKKSLACVVQPDTHLVCPSGTTYDTEEEVCVYIPPKQAVCPEDSIYDPDLDKCVYEPERIAVCPEASEYDEQLDICKYIPDTKKVCNNEDLLVEYNGDKYCGMGDVYSHESCSEDFGGGYHTKIEYEGELMCLRDADIEYEPCDEGYSNTGTGLCTRNPEYDYTVTCPAGFSKINEVCVADTIEKVDCNPGYHYDIVSGKCSRIMPSKYYCEKEGGTWSPADSTCYQEPLLSYKSCPEGMDWSETREACLMDRPIENTYICTEGTFDPITVKCIISPDAEPVDPIIGNPICESGEYNPTTKQCEIGSSVIVGPTPTQIEETETTALYLGLFAFIVVTGIITGLVITKIPR